MNKRLLIVVIVIVAATAIVAVVMPLIAYVTYRNTMDKMEETARAQAEREKVFEYAKLRLLAEDLPREYQGRPLLWIPKLDAPAALTGDLGTPQWKNAAALTLNDPATGQSPKHETTARVFCTDSALYFGFHCAEPSTDPLKTTGEFWNRDEVEIFLEPYKDTLQRPYHQIMVDAAGNMEFSRMHVYKRYFEEHALTEKWAPKVEVKVARGEGAWTAEVRIPFAELTLSDEARVKKTLWRLNVCRIRPARGGDLGIIWSWAPLGGASFQWPARFGYALPQTFASERLIQNVCATAEGAADLSLARSKDPAVLAEISETIPKLSLDAKDEAGRAAEAKLKALALVGPALFGVVEGALNEAAKESKARTGKVANYGAVRDFLFKLADWKPDEDPPPKSVLDKLAAWEPREAKDDAGNVVGYRLLKPKDWDPARKYPLFIWLHGSAERGTDNKKQLYSGVWEYAADDVRATYNCFVMAPQCPYTMGWGDTRSGAGSLDAMKATSNYRLAEEPNAVTKILIATIEGLEKEFPLLDADRVYISGSSMGGFGAWELIMRRPDLFAAAAPVCGGGDETQAARVAKLPIWMFHGEKDEAVKVQASRTMHAALKALGAPVFYREVPGAPHAIGDPTIRPDMLDWLFNQRRGKPCVPPAHEGPR